MTSYSDSPSAETVATGCEWKPSEDGQWDTTCGGTFEFVNGDPAMNGFRFCCYCGLTLDQRPYEDEEEDDEWDGDEDRE